MSGGREAPALCAVLVWTGAAAAVLALWVPWWKVVMTVPYLGGSTTIAQAAGPFRAGEWTQAAEAGMLGALAVLGALFLLAAAWAERGLRGSRDEARQMTFRWTAVPGAILMLTTALFSVLVWPAWAGVGRFWVADGPVLAEGGAGWFLAVLAGWAAITSVAVGPRIADREGAEAPEPDARTRGEQNPRAD